MVQQKQLKFLKIIFVLSILGMILAGYLVEVHYSKKSSPCDFSKTLSCSIVNRSQYAEFFGIPVALLGLGGYLFLGSVSLALIKNNWRERLKQKFLFSKLISLKTLLFFSVMALLFSFYLTYAELFLIKSVCVLCIVSQVFILTIVILSYGAIRLKKKSEAKRYENS